jgi:hypothetical protein
MGIPPINNPLGRLAHKRLKRTNCKVKRTNPPRIKNIEIQRRAEKGCRSRIGAMIP